MWHYFLLVYYFVSDAEPLNLRALKHLLETTMKTKSKWNSVYESIPTHSYRLNPCFHLSFHQRDRSLSSLNRAFTKHSVLSTGKNADLYQNLYFLPWVWPSHQIILLFPILLVVRTFLNLFHKYFLFLPSVGDPFPPWWEHRCMGGTGGRGVGKEAVSSSCVGNEQFKLPWVV